MSKKILIVDDEPDLVNLLTSRLQTEGYETRGSGDAKEAMQEIEKDRPDLIILDIMLPMIDGTKLCWVLKKGEKHKSIPIIMISAKKPEEVEPILKTIQADAFIAKPFEPGRLVSKVKELLS
jgi:DNA-binding response OmpR family regulator